MTQDFVAVAVLLRELTVQSESNTAQANNRRSAGAYIAALPPLGAVRGKEPGRGDLFCILKMREYYVADG